MSAEGTPFHVEASLNGAADCAYSGSGEHIDVGAGVVDGKGVVLSAICLAGVTVPSASRTIPREAIGDIRNLFEPKECPNSFPAAACSSDLTQVALKASAVLTISVLRSRLFTNPLSALSL
jgi:hypothetical protein